MAHVTLSPVATTGAPGAYSHEAARHLFGDDLATLTCSDSAEAVRAVSEGRAGCAVVPIENTVTGCFAGVVEALFGVGEVRVVAEAVLELRPCLLATPGTQLEDIAVVTSHPSALSQCRDWLTSWGVATRTSKDTAEAARELAASGDAALGVLGSRSLADTYDLEVLAEGLSDLPDNKNRFFVIAPAGSDALETRRGSAMRSAALVGPVTTPRALKTLRIQLESLGAWRARAPYLGSEDGTQFVIEFEHPVGRGADIVASACGELPYRMLGTWCPPEGTVEERESA